VFIEAKHGCQVSTKSKWKSHTQKKQISGAFYHTQKNLRSQTKLPVRKVSKHRKYLEIDFLYKGFLTQSFPNSKISKRRQLLN
jgi:hypothetical protein